jgi:hypothetical protein
MVVWCTKTCAKRDIGHSMEHKYITCPAGNEAWEKSSPTSPQVNFRYLEYVVFEEGWIGGYVMGILWTRLLTSLPPTDSPNGGSSNPPKEPATLAQVSPYAETLAAFSTISQEVRHESQPSWIFEEETVRGMWIRAHTLLLQALKIHPAFPRVEKFLTLEQFLLHLGTPKSPRLV